MEKWNDTVYKMSRKLQNETSRYQVQNQKDTSNRKQRIEQQKNWQRTWYDKSKRFTQVHSTIHTFCHMQVHLSRITSPRWNHLWTIQACLLQRPLFSQHVSWRCCNHLSILSSMVEILLFNSVFHDGVTPVSVLTLKPPLGAIDVLPLKPWAFPKLSVCI